MTCTTERQEAIEKAGGQTARGEDPESHRTYVVVEEEPYRKLRDSGPDSDYPMREFEEVIQVE
jgi:hypothetical protein